MNFLCVLNVAMAVLNILAAVFLNSPLSYCIAVFCALAAYLTYTKH